ncbi:B3 domain-containing protein Os11g0197600-like isoform X2 [Hordeum vulgare subsp. vulgare]|uniref:B3 domain-containing protein Os11g0197600-like isoform X2 n=1 Tax=Hordeum vulgare subsp. vulgare TaxID=112509 RepID=UPI001D1A4746|nr:B3 domain-containing protein Os11g0197600-like isoform X2 [Hordeum vulgare subsp. vulgare]
MLLSGMVGSRRRELQERDRRRREEEESAWREERERERREAAAEKEKGKGKEREGENGGEGGKFGQQFARVFLPQLYGDRLKIPPSFNQYLQNQPTGLVSLKGQSGNTWRAELASDNEGFFFVKGWKEFVRDHSIETGHFLTFRYDGRSQFSVVIFDGMCIEKPSAFHAKPCKNLVVKLESGKGDMDINAADPSQVSAAPLEESNEATVKRVTEMDANGSTSKKRSSILENGMSEASAVTCKVAPTSLKMDLNAADPPEAVVVPLEEGNRTTRERVRETDANDSALRKSLRVRETDANDSALHKSSRVREIDANDSALQKSLRVREIDANDSALQKSLWVRDIDANGSVLQKSSIALDKDKKRCPAASVGTYKSASTSLDSTEDSDSSSSMLEQSISCIKSELTSPIRLGVSKDAARRGNNSATGKRQLKVISQRPRITEIQKDNTLLRAKQFKSKNPFGLQIMKESYVYVGFFLNLPCEFVRECLPRANRKLKLWNPQGKFWDVNYVFNSKRSVGALSGGWGKFSLDNNLEKFDVCVFELFSKDNIKVYIYRVVPEITPFLPGPGKK